MTGGDAGRQELSGEEWGVCFMRFCGWSSLLHQVDGRKKSYPIEHRLFDLRLAFQGVVVGERGKESVGSVGKVPGEPAMPGSMVFRAGWELADAVARRTEFSAGFLQAAHESGIVTQRGRGLAVERRRGVAVGIALGVLVVATQTRHDGMGEYLALPLGSCLKGAGSSSA